MSSDSRRTPSSLQFVLAAAIGEYSCSCIHPLPELMHNFPNNVLVANERVNQKNLAAEADNAEIYLAACAAHLAVASPTNIDIDLTPPPPPSAALDPVCLTPQKREVRIEGQEKLQRRGTHAQPWQPQDTNGLSHPPPIPNRGSPAPRIAAGLPLDHR
ncbi:unnamed protein product [Cyclocybe aegerita]|uniref:Uncharacterized protein n=1 Tax=Cyclocybe aegerita TaxID=1973307 RepID=A0A8S0XCZ1_CYCAE|nr:unnamed protein product [Cyclocybe aegerita]